MKNYLGQRQESYSSPMSFFCSILSKNWYCYHEQQKNNILEPFTGNSFYDICEILLCKFCLRSMKIFEMSFRIPYSVSDTDFFWSLSVYQKER